jgi:hypothetical protein
MTGTGLLSYMRPVHEMIDTPLTLMKYALIGLVAFASLRMYQVFDTPV